MSIRHLPRATLAVAAVTAVLAVGGIMAVVSPGESAERQAASPVGPSGHDPEFARLFADGVAYMRQGQIHEAIIVFDAARKRQPEIPEVMVNLGFLHLARKDFKSAETAFGDALTLHPGQVNAYYGLALALEGRGDLEQALGAMRTFEHLEPETSPFHRKASAAVWEWEEQLRLRRDGKPMEIPPGAVSLPDKQPVTSPEQLRRDYVPPAGAKP